MWCLSKARQGNKEVWRGGFEAWRRQKHGPKVVSELNTARVHGLQRRLFLPIAACRPFHSTLGLVLSTVLGLVYFELPSARQQYRRRPPFSSFFADSFLDNCCP